MQKLFITMVLLCAVVCTGMTQKAIIKVNLYTFIKFSDPEVYLEYNLDEKMSIDAALRLGFNNSPFSNQIHANVDLRVGYRYYPLQKMFEAPIGLFLRPVAGFTSLYGGGPNTGGGINQTNNRRSSIQLGGTGGLQYVFKKKFAIDLFYGQAYHFSLNDNIGSGFQPVYNIGVGYAF